MGPPAGKLLGSAHSAQCRLVSRRLLRKRPPGREEGNCGVGQTKEELNSLSLSKKTREGKAPSATHSHPMAKTPNTRAAAEVLGQRPAKTKRRREVSGVEGLALSSGQSSWAPTYRKGIPGVAVSPQEPPGWPQSHSVPLVYPLTFQTEWETGGGTPGETLGTLTWLGTLTAGSPILSPPGANCPWNPALGQDGGGPWAQARAGL